MAYSYHDTSLVNDHLQPLDIQLLEKDKEIKGLNVLIEMLTQEGERYGDMATQFREEVERTIDEDKKKDNTIKSLELGVTEEGVVMHTIQEQIGKMLKAEISLSDTTRESLEDLLSLTASGIEIARLSMNSPKVLGKASES